MVSDFYVENKIKEADKQGKEFFPSFSDNEDEWIQTYSEGEKSRYISKDNKKYKLTIAERSFYYSEDYCYDIKVFSTSSTFKYMNKMSYNEVLYFYKEKQFFLNFFIQMGKEKYETYVGFLEDLDSIILYFKFVS